MSHRVYVAASNQKHNIGVLNYGTEQDNMMMLADRVKYWLGTQKGKFVVFRNQKNWSLKQTVDDCNNLVCELFIDNHTNAGPVEDRAGDGGAEGTEAFYYHQGGMTCKSYELANLVYKAIAPLSPGKDRGLLPDDRYAGSLYVIQKTDPPATLVEHFFHTNKQEVIDFLQKLDAYAKAEAQAICQFCGEVWIEPNKKLDDVEQLVHAMSAKGFITDEVYWLQVLMGEVQVNPEYLQILFKRTVI